MKKTILSIGGLAAVAAPTTAKVSCENTKEVHYVKGKTCPTCMKDIKTWDRVEFNVKTGTTRHYSCSLLRPEQVRAIKELETVMASIKIRGI